MNAVEGSSSPVVAHNGPVRFRRRELTADAHAAGQARYDLDGWLERHFVLSPTSKIDITMAVYEAVANVADHAYIGWPPGTGTFDVDAFYDFAQGTLTVTIEDQGTWHTRDVAAAANNSRGRGIQLIYGLSDQASVTSTATGTRVGLMWMGLQLRPY